MIHQLCTSSAKPLARSRRSRRGGAVTIEFLVVLPVLLSALLAVGQFGYYFQRVEQLMLASRVGAEAASQTAGLVDGNPVPTNIADVINHQLASSGITTVAIVVEYLGAAPPKSVLRTDYVANSFSVPTAPLPTQSVRVSVVVPLGNLMPNSLSFIGLDISTRNAVSSTTFSYAP